MKILDLSGLMLAIITLSGFTYALLHADGLVKIIGQSGETFSNVLKTAEQK